MAVTQAIACQASETNILDSLLEWVQDEFAELNSTTFATYDATTNPTGRKDVTHVGFGLRTSFDLPRRPLHSGIDVDVSCRADIFSIDINPLDSITEPEHPTPKVTIGLDITAEDENGNSRWLLNDASSSTHLRSLDTWVSWSARDDWEVEATLHDAAFLGTYNWNGSMPGRINVSSQSQGAGFSELVDAFLDSYSLNEEQRGVEITMHVLSALGLASWSTVTPAQEHHQSKRWEVLHSTFDVMMTDPGSYFNQLFTNVSGTWALGAINIPPKFIPLWIDEVEVVDDIATAVSSEPHGLDGNTLLTINGNQDAFDITDCGINVIDEHSFSFVTTVSPGTYTYPDGSWTSWNHTTLLELIASVIEPATYEYDEDDPMKGELHIEIPMFKKRITLDLSLSTEGVFGFEIPNLEFGGISAGFNASIDLSTSFNSSNGVDFEAGLLISSDFPLRGGFNSFNLRADYDSKLTSDNFTISFELPDLDQVLLVDTTSSSPTFSWDSINPVLQLYPTPQGYTGLQHVQEYLWNIIPTISIQISTQLLIERCLFANMKANSLIGESMEILGLAIQQGSQYHFTSLLPLLQDPLGYLKTRFLHPQGGIRAGPVVQFTTALFTALDAPYNIINIEDEDNEECVNSIGVALELRIQGNLVAEFCVMESPLSSTPDTLSFAIRTPQDNPITFKKRKYMETGVLVGSPYAIDSTTFLDIHFSTHIVQPSALSFPFSVGDSVLDSNGDFVGIVKSIVTPSTPSISTPYQIELRSNNAILLNQYDNLGIKKLVGNTVLELDICAMLTINNDWSLSAIGSGVGLEFYPIRLGGFKQKKTLCTTCDKIADDHGQSCPTPTGSCVCVNITKPYSGAISMVDDSSIGINFEIQSNCLSLTLDVALEGQSSKATLTILPTLSGWTDFLKSLLSSAVDFLLPKLLTKLLHGIYERKPILGEELMDVAYGLGLWDWELDASAYYSTAGATDLANLISSQGGGPCQGGTFDESKITTLAADPKQWLVDNKDSLLYTAVNFALTTFFPAPTAPADPEFAAIGDGNCTRLGMYVHDGTQVVISSNGGLLDGFVLEIGKKTISTNVMYGIWISYSPTFNINQHVSWSTGTGTLTDPSPPGSTPAEWSYTAASQPVLTLGDGGSDYTIDDTISFADPDGGSNQITITVSGVDNGVINSFHTNTKETTLPDLLTYLSVGVTYDSTNDNWGASFKVNVGADDDFFNGNGPVNMQPCLKFSYQSGIVDPLSLSLGTDYDLDGGSILDGDDPSWLHLSGGSAGDSVGFWIKLLPSPIECAAPTLVDMLIDMADVALQFVGKIQAVQDWLHTPLYEFSPTGSESATQKAIKEALSEISVPGKMFVSFGIMAHAPPLKESPPDSGIMIAWSDYGTLPVDGTNPYNWPSRQCDDDLNASPQLPGTLGSFPAPTLTSTTSLPTNKIYYIFRKISNPSGGNGWASGSGEGIIQHYTNPFEALLSGLCSLIGDAIANVGVGYTVDDETGMMLYEHHDSTIPFTISLVDKNDSPVDSEYGIRFWFDEVVLKQGLLKLFFQNTDDLGWTGRNPGDSDQYLSGVTLYFAKWTPQGTTKVTPQLSLEIAGLGLEVGKDNDEPLLEKFLCLNKVSLVTAFDLNILPGPATVEFGGQLILDDFGIELGGDGESDGGNGMAAGLLKGGEDGKDAVKPSFDLLLSSYRDDIATWNFDVQIKDGQTEFWFPINKDFGPLKIEQIGVRYFEDTGEHRLGILIDGSAEVAGFKAQVDDLMVSFPLLDPFDFKKERTLGWKFDLAGLAIAYDSGAFSIAGALRKETGYAYFPQGTIAPHLDIISPGPNPLPDGMAAADALKYAEYQGLCTITTDTLGISAIGAFARVPNADGTGFVSVFVIAALNMPLGGPPFFFVTGLLGGLGLNRQLAIPDIADVPQHLFIQTLGGGLAEDPMGALNLIKSQFPIEHGSFWFAAGLKFTSFQIIESKAVLFIKIDTGFTIGIVALSAMSLPSKELNIGYVELALLAYYSSEEQVLWVQAQLTDASYIFSQSCRLTGGFALVTWFKTGEFVLSLGGYHPNFKAPDYYPVVPRIGFNWSPTSSVTVKGGVYFTLCTSAVMLGGGLDASYNKGKLSAGFRMGLDVLVVFDPFYYEFGMYIELYVKYKTWLKTFKASIGADLQIQGPKMRGTAKITLVFITFTVKFGSDNQGSITAISGTQFLNKHVRQLPEAEANDTPSSDWIDTDFMNANVLMGVARPASAKNDDGSDKDGLPTGEIDTDPWLLEPEFDFSLGHKFPATEMQFRRFVGGDNELDILEESTDSMDLAPMFKTNQTSRADIILYKKCIDSNCPVGGWHVMIEDTQTTFYSSNCAGLDYSNPNGIVVSSRETFFPDTIWSYTAGTAGKPKAKTTAGEQLKFLSSHVISGRCYLEGGIDPLNLEGKVEPCEMTHYIPLHESSGINNNLVGDYTILLSEVMKTPLFNYESIITNDDSNKSLMTAMIGMIYDDDADSVKNTYIKETAKVNSFDDINDVDDIKFSNLKSDSIANVGYDRVVRRDVKVRGDL